MDIKLTPRGRFTVENGRFATVRNSTELLSQYLNAVLTDNIRSNTFPSIRASDIKLPSKIGQYKLDVQQRIIEIIKSSPFSYDFESEFIQVIVERSGEDSIFIGISYDKGDQELISAGFTFDGGRLVLPEEIESAYDSQSEFRTIEEEIVIIEPTDEITVSCEPFGPLYICPEGTGLITEQIELDLKSFPDQERVIKRGVELVNGFYNVLGSSESRSLLEQEVDPEGGYLDSKTYDSFLMGTFLKNRGINFKLIDIRVISGTVNLLRYVSEIEDWILEVPITQEFVTLEIDSLEAVETAENFEYGDIKSYGNSAQYPFREEATRGRKYYTLDTILNPGVYSIFYRGIVKNRYNGSLEEG